MKRRNPVFTVEIKRNKRTSSNWVEQAERRHDTGLRPPAPVLWAEPPQEADRPLFEERDDRGPAPAASEPSPRATRLLPDLLSVEALERQARQQFEEKSASTRTPRLPRPEQDGSASPRRADAGHADLERRKAKPGAPRKGREHAPAALEERAPAQSPELPRVALPNGSDPVSADVIAALAEYRRAADRRTTVLKRGERWKRRLPRVCW